MSRLQLDPRRVAMLREMGLRVGSRPAPAVADPGAMPARAGTPDTRAAARAAARAATAALVAAPSPPPSSPVLAPVSPGRPPLASRPAGVEAMDWDALAGAVAGCRACKLCDGRRHTVFGAGSTQARWMVVGEAPGENEDAQGLPFVGQAGALLDNMLRAIGLARGGTGAQGVYIANVLKCRPPANRNPEPDEVAQCEPYLKRQVELLQPKIILAMGRFAVQSLLQTHDAIGKLRGRLHQYHGVPVVVTYHPAYLLRSPAEKGKAWADLCLALETMAGR